MPQLTQERQNRVALTFDEGEIRAQQRAQRKLSKERYSLPPEQRIMLSKLVVPTGKPNQYIREREPTKGLASKLGFNTGKTEFRTLSPQAVKLVWLGRDGAIAPAVEEIASGEPLEVQDPPVGMEGVDGRDASPTLMVLPRNPRAFEDQPNY